MKFRFLKPLLQTAGFSYFVAFTLIALSFVNYFWMLAVQNGESFLTKEINNNLPHVILAISVGLSSLLAVLILRLNKARKKLDENNKIIAASEDSLIEAQTIAKIGSWSYDPAQNAMKWTKEMFQIFRCDIKLGEPNIYDLKTCLVPEDYEHIKENFVSVLKHGKAFADIYRLSLPTGETVWIEFRGEPVWDGNLKVVAVQGTCQDISEKIELEIEIRKQQALSFHQSKLAAIGQLAAGVGHEINNPLAIIDGNAMRIETKSQLGKLKQEDLEKYIEKIRSSVSRIKTITTGLRTFSRSDNDSMTVTSIKAALLQSMDMLKDIYKNEQIDLKFVDDGKPDNAYEIKSNYGRIQQMILNLVGNARDASKGREDSKVLVSLVSRPECLEISVEDNGPGIDPDIQDDIFNPFYTTKAVNEGTGLGLSIVSAIVKDHEGKIDLESEPEKGTRFTIKLPKAS